VSFIIVCRYINLFVVDYIFILVATRLNIVNVFAYFVDYCDIAGKIKQP
jgi:hypothetical protein